MRNDCNWSARFLNINWNCEYFSSVKKLLYFITRFLGVFPVIFVVDIFVFLNSCSCMVSTLTFHPQSRAFRPSPPAARRGPRTAPHAADRCPRPPRPAAASCEGPPAPSGTGPTWTPAPALMIVQKDVYPRTLLRN